ncbi:MAG: hypothetical protein LUD25_01585 [Coriobacteriaceae bacterium]|nr:hypothetical protein [Coriobacteriaceae bacterium]
MKHQMYATKGTSALKPQQRTYNGTVKVIDTLHPQACIGTEVEDYLDDMCGSTLTKPGKQRILAGCACALFAVVLFGLTVLPAFL